MVAQRPATANGISQHAASRGPWSRSAPGRGRQRGRPRKRIAAVMRIQGVVNDEADFAGFYARSRDACLRAVQVSVADRQLAEDLLAEAFARAWANWRQVRHHPAP